MNIMYRILVVLLFFFYHAGICYAQSDAQLTAVVKELFNYAQNENYAEAAGFIAYQGSDESRNLTDPYNSKDKSELKQVARICMKIEAFIDLSDSYEFGRFDSFTEEGRKILSKEVLFKNKGQTLSTLFYFAPTEKGLLLIKFY
jgi:hypothetical protein